MIHFLYLVGFALLVAAMFAVLSKGSVEERVKYGIKSFAQFFLISLALAWIFYFIPW